MGAIIFDDVGVLETMIFDDACVPKENSRLSCAESKLPKLDAVLDRWGYFWPVIMPLSSPGVHEGEKDELAVWDRAEGVRFRPRIAAGGGGMTTRRTSLSAANCKGGSLVDPRLSCDMCEEALSLR